MAETARVLVVANRTAESPELLNALQERAGRGPCELTLLVPQTPHGLAWAADPDGPDETPLTRRPCSAPPPGGLSRGSKPPAGSTSSTAAPSGARGVAGRPGGG